MTKRFKTIGDPLSPKALAEKKRLEELAHVATGGIFRPGQEERRERFIAEYTAHRAARDARTKRL